MDDTHRIEIEFKGFEQKIVAVHWCFWQSSSFKRKDHASVAQPHDERGVSVALYWLAWPPYIEAGIERQVMNRRFRSAYAAMDFADRQWPLSE